MRILALTLLLLAATLSACGGGSTGGEAYRESAARAVREASLTLDDLPEGWSESALGEAALTQLELTSDCSQLNGLGSAFPGQVATGDPGSYAGPVGQELLTIVSVFTDENAAVAAVRLADDLVAGCKAELEEALKSAIEAAAADRNLDGLLNRIDASLEPDGFERFGDETLAYRLQASFSALFQQFEVNGHIIAIRQGPLTGILIYAVLGDLDTDEEESVAAALARTLAEAESSLPD